MKKEPEKAAIIETDAIVSTMGRFRDGEKKRAALYIFYVYRFSYGRGAKVLRCSRSYFQGLVESGQDIVAGGLMALNLHSANKPSRNAGLA